MAENRKRVINVVAGLIWRDGKLLVCQRRAEGAFPLKWEFPGGKLEEGETDIDALRRELQEELAIDVRNAVLVYDHHHCYAGGPTVSLHFYNVHEMDGEVKNLVFERIAWVQLSDLDKLDFLAGDRPFIQKLLSEGPPV
jgi:8-oxo-dGTP diphosphatase